MKRSSVQIQFPTGGIARRVAVQNQSPYTCFDALNVFPDDPFLERERGGSRPPLKQHSSAGSAPVRLMKEFGYVDSSDDRQQVVMVVGDGSLYELNGGTASSVGTGVVTDKYVTGCALGGRFYVAGDSSSNRNIMVYDPVAGTFANMTASSGTIPTKCRTIDRWRDRLLAVSESAPWVLRMSKQGDPTNWDYGASGTDRAVNLSSTEAGQLGQPIVALIPRDDNVLIICTTVGMWELRGDPTIGGRLYPLNEQLAILGPHAWCEDSERNLFVMTNDGLYFHSPGHGSPFFSMSREKLPKDFANIDRDDYTISMCYDKKLRGVFVFITEESGSDTDINPAFCGTMSQGSDPPDGFSLLVTHFFVDVRNVAGGDGVNRSASFWPMSLQSTNEPTFAMSVNGYASDQGSLYGTKSGKLLHFERGATSSTMPGGSTARVKQGAASGAVESIYRSYVVIGPVLLGAVNQTGVFESLLASLPKDSGDVEFDLYVGDDAENSILKSSPDFSGTWDLEGLSYREHPRLRGKFAWIVLRGASTDGWAFESLDLVRAVGGRNRVH